MNIASPGLGEVSDRLTILALKILIGTEQGKDVAHFQRERALLLAKVRSRTPNGAWFDSVMELAAVNGQLWKAEDDLRALRATVPEQCHEGEAVSVMRIAFRIQALNDRRAELVAQINKDAGESQGEEKISS
jgi:hypothetical protein